MCAGRIVALLGAIFTYAVRQGVRLDNRVHGVVEFAEGRRQRRLIDQAYPMLGMALSKAKHEVSPSNRRHMVDGLTGWRRGEVLGLRWWEIDLPRRTARLADTGPAHPFGVFRSEPVR